ncbi:MAG: hypothetical protein R3A10_02730 [Caldilineaceae bacterium]
MPDATSPDEAEAYVSGSQEPETSLLMTAFARGGRGDERCCTRGRSAAPALPPMTQLGWRRRRASTPSTMPTCALRGHGGRLILTAPARATLPADGLLPPADR